MHQPHKMAQGCCATRQVPRFHHMYPINACYLAGRQASKTQDLSRIFVSSTKAPTPPRLHTQTHCQDSGTAPPRRNCRPPWYLANLAPSIFLKRHHQQSPSPPSSLVTGHAPYYAASNSGRLTTDLQFASARGIGPSLVPPYWAHYSTRSNPHFLLGRLH